MPTKTKPKPNRKSPAKVTKVAIKTDAPPLRMDSTGTIRIGETRVTLDTLVGAFLRGASAELIADQYPSLTVADVYSSIGYYLSHRNQLDEYLKKRGEEADILQKEIEAQFPPHGLRARLLARQKESAKL